LAVVAVVVMVLAAVVGAQAGSVPLQDFLLPLGLFTQLQLVRVVRLVLGSHRIHQIILLAVVLFSQVLLQRVVVWVVLEITQLRRLLVEMVVLVVAAVALLPTMLAAQPAPAVKVLLVVQDSKVLTILVVVEEVLGRLALMLAQLLVAMGVLV
jgi:hypothetical protein